MVGEQVVYNHNSIEINEQPVPVNSIVHCVLVVVMEMFLV